MHESKRKLHDNAKNLYDIRWAIGAPIRMAAL